jgi:hypothetical protein
MPRFTPGNTPGAVDPRLGRVVKSNAAWGVVGEGLNIAYSRMLTQNLNSLVPRLAADPEAARRYLAEYAEWEGMSWAERRARDFGGFLGLNDEEFIEDYFVPEVRAYLRDLLGYDQGGPMNPNDRLGVLTPGIMSRTRDTTLADRYTRQEHQQMTRLLHDRQEAPAPKAAPRDDDEDKDKKDPRSRVKAGKVTKGKVGSHLDDDEPKTYGRQGTSSNTVDSDYGNSGRESQARKQQRNSSNGNYDSHNDSGPSGGGSSDGAPSGGAPAAPAPSGGGAPSGNASPGSGGPPTGAGPAPEPGPGKLNKLDADPPSGGGGGADPSKRV